MRFSKAPILLFTAALMLTSCSKDSIAGTYAFQMGKEKGTHFGIFVELTDNYVTLKSQPDVTSKYKSCTFSFTMSDGSSETSESTTNIMELIAGLLNQEGSTITIPAYYYKGDKKLKDGERELKVGIDFSFIKETVDDIDTEQEFPVLEPNVIEQLIYTTYQGNTINMYIPVGQEDAFLQLYWYGYDVAWDSDGIKIQASPYGEHEPGTHPTKEDIDAINKDDAFKKSHEVIAALLGFNISAYRDYHTLNMGLTKK